MHINSPNGIGPLRIQNEGSTKFRIFDNNAISFGTNWSNPIPNVVRFSNPNIFMGFNGSHIPQNRLEIDGNIWTSGLIMPTGAVDGYVLKTDGNGLASWQEESNGNSGTDQLGSFNESFSDDFSGPLNFGRAVSVVQDLVLVGASFGTGRRYWIEFENNVWGVNNGSFESGESGFGRAVDLSDDYLAVGAPFSNSLSGSVHFYGYSPNTISPFGSVTGSQVVNGDQFGTSVAFDGDFLAVGAPQGGPGAVYIFEIDNVNNVLIEQEILDGDFLFGIDLDIEGDVLVVGEPTAGGGSVFIFERSGTDWLLEQTLTSTGVGNFGSAVRISGDKIVIGSIAGSVQVWNNSGGTWLLEQDITPEFSEFGDGYGYSVDILGDDLVFGAPFFDVNSNLNAGALYHYTFDGSQWNFKSIFFDPNPEFDDRLGMSIATDGVNVVGGAPFAMLGAQSGKGKVLIKSLD